MKKLAVLVLTSLGLAGCYSTELSTQGKAYDATKDARVRVYGQNGRPSSLETTVNGKAEKITVGGSLGQAFSSMVGAKDNESIGMPATPLSKNPSAHSKLLSGIFFKEFIVPAGATVVVNNSIMDTTSQSVGYTLTHKITTTTTVKGCSGNTVTFETEAGKDYEVAPISSDRQCGVTVYEIK